MGQTIFNMLVEIGKAALISVAVIVIFVVFVQARAEKEK